MLKGEKYSCDWCHSSADYLLSRKDNARLYKCPNCQLISVKRKRDIKSYYKKEYFTSEEGSGIGYDVDYEFSNPINLLWQGLFVAYLSKITGLKEMIDVGSATGNLIEWINTIDESIKAWAYDVSKFALDLCESKGLNIIKTMDKMTGFDKSIIYSAETLEHVSSVNKTINNHISLIGSNGLLVYYVPIVEMNILEEQKEDYHLIASSFDHTYYFTNDFINKINIPGVYKFCTNIDLGSCRPAIIIFSKNKQIIDKLNDALDFNKKKIPTDDIGKTFMIAVNAMTGSIESKYCNKLTSSVSEKSSYYDIVKLLNSYYRWDFVSAKKTAIDMYYKKPSFIMLKSINSINDNICKENTN